jgi:hypothetical protein
LVGSAVLRLSAQVLARDMPGRFSFVTSEGLAAVGLVAIVAACYQMVQRRRTRVSDRS